MIINFIMSDEEQSPEEVLLARHRKEKKELQGKIQGLKKTSSKGDKKKKKEVTEEIARLEEELKIRHNQELQELKSNPEVASVAEKLENTSVSDDVTGSEDKKEEDVSGNQPRLSKAEKRRLNKEQKEREREAEIKAAEEANKYGPRNLETQAIKDQLTSRGLCIHDVPSNGDCMFAAICHQIGQVEKINGIEDLRHETADELRRNKSDYFPFLTNSNTGEMLSDAEFEEYCDKMSSSKSAWGSQVELRAISQILKLRIEVIQGQGPVVIIGEDHTAKQPVVVTFHKHYFGLGEHYNSTKAMGK